MVSIKDTLNAGTVANPSEWLDSALQRAATYGFPICILVDVDAAMASELLERNTHNRQMRTRRADRYRHDMALGLWKTNGETIVITSEGVMISGQHRCAAIAETDLVIPIFLAIGVDPSCDATVDQGAPKHAGDYLAVRGEANAPTAAKISRLRLAYDANNGEMLKDTATPTNADVVSYFDTHKEDVERSASLAESLREFVRRLAAPSVIGFAHNVLHDIDPDSADRYIEQVAKGEDIKEGDASFAVRNRLLNMGKAGVAQKAEIILSGWNAFRANRTIKNIRVTGRLPRVA